MIGSLSASLMRARSSARNASHSVTITERGGAFGAKIGVLTKGNIGQDLPGLLNRLRIVGAYFRPGRLSTIVWRAAKAPPNGGASSPASTSAASPAKAST